MTVVPGRRKQKRTERSKLDATPPWDQRVREPAEATTGPFDSADAPEDELPRVDLGALLIPVVEGHDLRLDLNETQQVVSATYAVASGTMQVGVFAAPRVDGIWDEVRAEIAESLREQGRQLRNAPEPSEAEGPFGTELHGVLPAEGGVVPVRFVGVDGPRWFLRAMFAGPLAQDSEGAAPLEDALRQTVVVRGSGPLPVREPVPLTLPDGVELPTAET